MVDPLLTPRSPWPNFADSGGPAGVKVRVMDGLGLATVIVRRGQLPALTERVRDRFGMVLPQGACRTEAEGLAFARTGPEVWLAMRDSGDGFAEFLADEIGAAASVSDQSAGYAVLRLSGPKVVENLAKIIPVDLHPRAFKPGDVASTVASHIGVTLWRSEDAPDGSPVFYVAVFRSFAAGFWQALAESAAEFGFASESPG